MHVHGFDSGYSNAYTDSEDTNYYFTVDARYLTVRCVHARVCVHGGSCPTAALVLAPTLHTDPVLHAGSVRSVCAVFHCATAELRWVEAVADVHAF